MIILYFIKFLYSYCQIKGCRGTFDEITLLFLKNLLIKKSILYIIQKEKRMEETNEE